MNLHAIPFEGAPTPDPSQESGMVGPADFEKSALEIGRAALTNQALALTSAAKQLGDAFIEATRLIVECRGNVIVCGMGKSGQVAQKLSATLCCTGTASFFLHPAEARHGDLARVREGDVVLLISNSGGTEEVVSLLPHFGELGVPLIALVGQVDSAIGLAATVTLGTFVERETCPHNFVPTTSALVSMAVGDALAMAAMCARGTSADELLRNHPGGELGRRKTGGVRDKMHPEDPPLVSPTDPLVCALKKMSDSGSGLVIATDSLRRPLGIVTDGDLRRIIAARSREVESLTVADVMTHDPVTVHASAHVDYAREKMHRLRLKALIVVNSENQVLGIIEIYDSP